MVGEGAGGYFIDYLLLLAFMCSPLTNDLVFVVCPYRSTMLVYSVMQAYSRTEPFLLSL